MHCAFASRPVIMPFDVDKMQMPKPLKTLGICFESTYQRAPGVLQRFNTFNTGTPFTYFKRITNDFNPFSEVFSSIPAMYPSFFKTEAIPLRTFEKGTQQSAL